MSTNPLFPSSSQPSDEPSSPDDELFGARKHTHIQPAANPAAELVRQKLDKLYSTEPDAAKEADEAKAVPRPRSVHQQFMYDLSTSGKSLAEIQSAWHEYYAGLSDDAKHDVWHEFYEASGQRHTPAPHHHSAAHRTAHAPATASTASAEPAPRAVVSEHAPAETAAAPDHRSSAAIKRHLKHTLGERRALKAKHHLQSILFGLGFGALVVIVTLFGFFNEVIIAPFIQPSRQAKATPIIIGNSDIAVSKTPEVIIPKINLEIPLDFSVTTTSEGSIENALDKGIIHYPTTVKPGEKGNAAFFGHSSNNIFNAGKYKFAFALLHELVPGDTFYLTYKGTSYAYQVYDKKVVKPSQVSVLNDVDGQTATAALITCDPPGTSINRLVVWGKQVSPDPAKNAAAAAQPTTDGADQALPGNGPTLWTRLIDQIKNVF